MTRPKPPIPLDEVLITEELDRRPSREPGFQAESQALVGLMKNLQSSTSDNTLQALADAALQLCRAHSSGLSVLENTPGTDVFRWTAAAGQWAGHLNGTVARAASPCGTVLDRNVPLLMARPERHYGRSVDDMPPLVEILLVPFRLDGVVVGTVWVIAHDGSRQFDREDLRVLTTLSEFASVAYQSVRGADQRQTALATAQASSRLLQAISTGLIQESEPEALHEQILDAAMTIMQSDHASMQTRDRASDDLQLLAWRGFHPESAQFWQRVQVESGSSCGHALRTKQRLVIADVEQCASLVGTADLEEYRRSGIRAVQSTPLIARSGELLGVLSTHWRRAHEPLSSELHLFDVLARLAADLLERALTERALREADRRKDEFLAIMSHELRNPLAPLSTGVELLRLPGNAPELVDELHSMMTRQLSHLVRLVDDLLDLSRLTSNKIELELASTDLRPMIEAAVELSRPLIHERGHRLTYEHAEGRLPVKGDVERLIQVIANVVGNAAKYMEPNGTIHLCTRAEGGEVVLRVRDSGFGIPAEQLELVFEMFNQVPEHRMRGGGGLGIGLALARRLLELHGGSIEGRSEGAGRGSEFVIRLPLAASRDALAASTAASVAAASPPQRVLIVDDNVDAASTLAAGLQVTGHTVRTAPDAAEAMLLIETFAPDLLLLDIGLPHVDGYELARRIRAMPAGDRFKLVAITGWGQDSDRERARAAGFDRHLTKPVRLQTINEVLKAITPAR